MHKQTMNQTLCPAGCCAFFLASGLHLIAFQNVSSRVMSHDHLSLSLPIVFSYLADYFFLKSSGLTFLCFLGVVSSTPSFSTSFSLLLRSLVHSSHVMYVAPAKCCTQIYGVLRGCCFGIICFSMRVLMLAPCISAKQPKLVSISWPLE